MEKIEGGTSFSLTTPHTSHSFTNRKRDNCAYLLVSELKDT